MKTFQKIGHVLTKILEIIHWIGTAAMVVLLSLAIFADDLLRDGLALQSSTLWVGSFELTVIGPNGELLLDALCLFALYAAIACALMALVLRNIHCMLGAVRNMAQRSPFCEEVTLRMKRVAVYLLCGSAVQAICSVVGSFMILAPEVTMRIDLTGALMGVLCMCLAGVFQYGTQLQTDVDGLV